VAVRGRTDIFRCRDRRNGMDVVVHCKHTTRRRERTRGTTIDCLHRSTGFRVIWRQDETKRGTMIVTVVTPTLNAVNYLRECIESARRNESPGVEVEHVIADGGSTDGTVELAESYGLRVLKGEGRIFDRHQHCIVQFLR
jgi:Glycosyl transferase family 2